MNEDLDKLERLGQLRDSGVLTKQEFLEAKAALLHDIQLPTAKYFELPLRGSLQDPPARSRPRIRWWMMVGGLIAVLIGTVAGLSVWHQSADIPIAMAQPVHSEVAPPAATLPAPARAPQTPAASAPAANAADDDSEADARADDEAYYANAAPYMQIPVRVMWQGQDYCCLTMGAVHDALQANDVEFKREDASHIDLTSTDLSTHPWRMITYAFAKQGSDWRLGQIIDSGGSNYDAHSAVSPDQELIEQFKLHPKATLTVSAQGRPPATHPLYSAQYTQCMATGDAKHGARAAILACTRTENDRQDAALNQAYRDAMGRLDPSRQATLRAFERDWLKRREATCRANSVAFAGGSLEAIDYSQCILDETIRRVAALNRVAR